MELAEAIELGTKKLAELNLDGRVIPKLYAYVKPTTHLQGCWICRESLRKGDMAVKEISGANRGGQNLTFRYSHLACYLAVVLHTLLELKGGK